MTRRINRWLLILIAVLVIPFWWLLMASSGGGGPPKPLHIADLRALAADIPGKRPTAVTATVLGTRLVIGDFFTGGIGVKRRALAVITWSLPMPDHAPILIDPGMPPAQANLGAITHVDGGKLHQVETEIGLASLVLQTQGPVPAQGAAGAPLPYHLRRKAGTHSAAGAPDQPASDAMAQAVAPGVVVIPTASHAPETRLIYVALADGREFLFTGDIAPMSENWTQLRIRSHLAALEGPPQNSDETYAWLRTIRQLHSEAPQLHVVPGHDYLWLTSERANGTIADMRFTTTRHHR